MISEKEGDVNPHLESPETEKRDSKDLLRGLLDPMNSNEKPEKPNKPLKIFTKSFQIKNNERMINCYAFADKKIHGQGAYGDIFRIVDKKSKQQDDIKCLKRVKQSNRAEAMAEINSLKSLSHPNILKFYEYFEDQSTLMIVIEYIKGYDLMDYIISSKSITEQKAAIIMRQLFEGLAYAHEKRIVHRDIKCDNIMIIDPEHTPIRHVLKNSKVNQQETERNVEDQSVEETVPSDSKQSSDIGVKLIDWGFSFNMGLIKKDYIENKQIRGTFLYISPEQIQLERYDEKCDIWSAGVVMYCLLVKLFPFQSSLVFSERFSVYKQEKLQKELASKEKLSAKTDTMTWSFNFNPANNAAAAAATDKCENYPVKQSEGVGNEQIVGGQENTVKKTVKNASQPEREEIGHFLKEAKQRFKKEQQVDLFKNIAKNEPAYDEKILSHEAIDLLKKLLVKDPTKRLSAVDALKHPWFLQAQREQVDREKVRSNLLRMKNFGYQNEFQCAVWQYISSHLVESSHKKELDAMFKDLDTDKNGLLSRDEIRNAFSAMELPPLDEEDLDAIFAVVDTDKNGFIDYNEFIMSTLHHHLLAGKNDLQRVFNLIDLDKNGKISLQELKNILGSPDQRNLPEFQGVFEDIFAKIDVNSDGEISFEEFESLITQNIMISESNGSEEQEKNAESNGNQSAKMTDILQ